MTNTLYESWILHECLIDSDLRWGLFRLVRTLASLLFCRRLGSDYPLGSAMNASPVSSAFRLVVLSSFFDFSSALVNVYPARGFGQVRSPRRSRDGPCGRALLLPRRLYSR